MINYREILRLNSLGYSQRRIEASVHSSHQTVKNVLEKASAQGISWPLEDDITNAILGEILSDRNTRTNSPYAKPDFAYIHKELSKKGVTLTLLWQEYCEKCRTNGQQPYMSTQFGDKYRRWARVTKATMCTLTSPATLCRSIGQAKRFRILTPLPVKNTRHICLLPRSLAAVTSTRKRAEI